MIMGWSVKLILFSSEITSISDRFFNDARVGINLDRLAWGLTSSCNCSKVRCT